MDSDEDKAGSDEENILMKELKDKEGDNKIQNPDLQRLFNPDRDEVFGKAYHDDGNSEFYSDENIKLREDLKSEGVVVEAINNFMKEAFGKTVHITRDMYYETFKNIGRILRPKAPEYELDKAIKEDFESDLEREAKDSGKAPEQNHETLEFQTMKWSLFELADLWCPNIDANEMVEFFATLKNKMKYRGTQDPTAYDVL